MDPFIFQKGYCLNCDLPINPGEILCPKCTPANAHEAIVVREVRVADMESGDEGYTEPYALFEVDGSLYIIGSAIVVPQSQDYKTARIRKYRDFYEVDHRSIDQNDISLIWPDICDNTDCFVAKLI